MAIVFKPAFVAKLNIETLFSLLKDTVHQQYGPQAEVNISFGGSLQDSSLSAIVVVHVPDAETTPVAAAAPHRDVSNGHDMHLPAAETI